MSVSVFRQTLEIPFGDYTIRAINVLMTSRPPIIDYTLCHILYIILEFIPYTIDCILCTWSIYIR